MRSSKSGATKRSIRSEQAMKADTIPEMPAKVKRAIQLLYCMLAIILVRILIGWVEAETIADIVMRVIDTLIFPAIYLLLIHKVRKGKNWARVVVLILAIAPVLISVMMVPAYAIIEALLQSRSHLLSSDYCATVAEILYLIERIPQVIAIAFLFQRDSSNWFKIVGELGRPTAWPNLVRGVTIVDFRPESSAEKAGMKKGDVIIDCNGVGNLTIDRLQSLAALPKPEGVRIRAVRDGIEYTVTLPEGSLGISATDTTAHSTLEETPDSRER